MTLQDIRKMDTDNNLPASPAETCQVRRSFVQEEENERLAIARRLCRTRPFPLLSSSEKEKLTARLESEEWPDAGRKCTTGEQAKSRRKRQRHTLSYVLVDIPESGWVLIDDVYMGKVYENIRWR